MDPEHFHEWARAQKPDINVSALSSRFASTLSMIKHGDADTKDIPSSGMIASANGLVPAQTTNVMLSAQSAARVAEIAANVNHTEKDSLSHQDRQTIQEHILGFQKTIDQAKKFSGDATAHAQLKGAELGIKGQELRLKISDGTAGEKEKADYVKEAHGFAQGAYFLARQQANQMSADSQKTILTQAIDEAAQKLPPQADVAPAAVATHPKAEPQAGVPTTATTDTPTISTSEVLQKMKGSTAATGGRATGDPKPAADQKDSPKTLLSQAIASVGGTPSSPAKLTIDANKNNDPKAVLEIQKRINADLPEGHKIKEDGKFGRQTDAAVRQWQQQHQLKPDGSVGPETLQKMVGEEKVPELDRASQALHAAKAATSAIGGNPAASSQTRETPAPSAPPMQHPPAERSGAQR